MSGFWEYGGYGHSGYYGHKTEQLMELFKAGGSVIEEGPLEFIVWAWNNFNATSVWSCQGHPDDCNYKGYITWIFETPEAHIRFMMFMNEIQSWMRIHGDKAVHVFQLESDPLYHPTTDYDTMGVPALTLRTMPFHNNRIRNRWWTELLETANKIKGFKRHQTKTTQGDI